VNPPFVGESEAGMRERCPRCNIHARISVASGRTFSPEICSPIQQKACGRYPQEWCVPCHSRLCGCAGVIGWCWSDMKPSLMGSGDAAIARDYQSRIRYVERTLLVDSVRKIHFSGAPRFDRHGTDTLGSSL